MQPCEVDMPSESVVQTLYFASAEEYLRALHPVASRSIEAVR
jgi:hypothetical protein